MDRPVTTTYLEMTGRDRLRPAKASPTPCELVQVREPDPELNRSLYVQVGAGYRWVDRLPWDRDRWLAWLDRPDLETWVLYSSGVQAGYFELERQAEGNVEIAYFGLLPDFIGRGLGGYLLTAAIERAWDMGATRVWVHTCDLDHPSALANYTARGFEVYRVESKTERFPDAEGSAPEQVSQVS